MALGRDDRRQRVGRATWLWLLCLLAALIVPIGAQAEPGDHLGSFGPDGTEGTEFGAPAALAVDQDSGAVYVGDLETQTLYKFNAVGEPLDWGGIGGNISGNELSGFSFKAISSGEAQVAVDSETHVVYVTSGNSVEAFDPSGEPHNFTAGPGEGTNEIPGASDLRGIAVDHFGSIYVSDFAAKLVRIYGRTGSLITAVELKSTELSLLRPANLAVDNDGRLYVSNYPGRTFRVEPSEFPVTASTTYTLGEEVNNQLTITMGVDPASNFVYIGEIVPTAVGVFDQEGKVVGTIGAEGQPGELTDTPAGVGVNGANATVYVAQRVEGESSGASRVEVYEAFSIPVLPPTLSGVAATDVTSTTASLRARINPNTLATTYWFEYGLEACDSGPEVCAKVPVDGASAGSGHQPIPVSVSIGGLSPTTTYHYRVVAENSEGRTESTDRSFQTPQNVFGSDLIDDRAWEQVTPPAKFGGVPTNANLLQAADDGSGIAFQTRGAIEEEPESNRALESSSVIARRSEDGWGIKDVVPLHTEAGGLGFGPEFKLFTPDLGKAVFEQRDNTPLSPEASERTPYLRVNSIPPSYRPLVTAKEGFANVAPGTVFGGEANGERNPVAISGANDALTHIALSSVPPLVSGAAPTSLYEWDDGKLEPVSERPADEGGGIVEAQLGSSTVSVRHAVSDDGSRIFWAPGEKVTPLTLPSALYLRDTEADETTRIDLNKSGDGSGAAAPIFMGADKEGTTVFFTDPQRLTADASAEGRDLYRCEVGDVGGSLGCAELVNLSAPLSGSEEDAEVQEVSPGMSSDGSTVYFVADGVLDPESNDQGESAAPGDPNLYVWKQGVGVRFIASLSRRDDRNWGEVGVDPIGSASRVSATASPSGRYLAFMSERNLTGGESDDPDTGEPVEQAFLYDSSGQDLWCMSCNPSGGTDAGHQINKGGSEGGVIFPDPQGMWSGRWVSATLPEASEGEPTIGLSLYKPRAVLDNGRAFFNSIAPLVSGDSNGTWDVYQFEPQGLGGCDSEARSGVVEVVEGGCVGLISSGTDGLPSVFMDSSASGDDVFFATFARLSILDTDDIVDVYDARVDGVEAVVEQHPECAGEACQPSGATPGTVTPNSATFNGHGNLNERPRKHCKKGQRKVKRNGKTKCVKAKKHNKKKQKQKSAWTERGA